MFKLSVIDNWDPTFFTEFVKLKNELHQGIENYLPETLEDYAKFFEEKSPFYGAFKWRGFLVLQGEMVVAKAVLCWKDDELIGNLGFIDWREDFSAAKFLWDEILSFAKSISIKRIKTPVDINFFVNFRVRLKTSHAPLYGEPIYPEYYQDFFERLGMDVIGNWDVYEVLRWPTILSFKKQRKQVETSEAAISAKVKIRPIQMNDWKNELKILHRLFLESYKVMPDFESITFEQFELLFDKFKYIASPKYCFIAELEGRPVGFSINYPDPSKILKSIHGKDLNFVSKIITLIRLKMNFSDLLIAHVGRVTGPNGEEIKGLQAKISKHLTMRAIWMNRAFIVQRSDAMSRRAWEKKNLRLYAQYALYGKSLE